MPETTMGIPYPASTDPPDGPSQMGALAAAVDTLLNLPDAVNGFTATNNTITSTTMAAIPNACQVAITNPSADYDMEVDISFGGWAASSVTTVQLQVGVAATGGLTFAADSLGSGGAVVNGELILTQNVDAHGTRSGFPVIIPAGAAAVTFAVQAKRSSASGTQIFNQPYIRVMPRRFLVP